MGGCVLAGFSWSFLSPLQKLSVDFHIHQSHEIQVTALFSCLQLSEHIYTIWEGNESCIPFMFFVTIDTHTVS